MNQYRKNLRQAMNWLRQQQPDEEFKTIHHGFYGHAVMVKSRGEGFRYYVQCASLIEQWKRAGEP